jgi:hypothetical protein
MGFGATGAATHLQGDADADHDVDGNDFLIWQRQLVGGQAGQSTSQSAPEPASVLLVALGTAAILCRSVDSPTNIRALRRRQGACSRPATR